MRATIINLKSQLEQVQMGQGTSSTGSPSPTGAPIEGLVDEHGNPYYS
ncbi:MAG: hypothetical protein U9Q15_04135 [Patescibacteria group bacterium]|nr:hypothetical protein [Patescibacteria group bacterium]